MPALEYFFVDFETFYSKEYTLKKLDAPSYILDPRFEAICLGVARGFEGKPYLVDGPDIPTYLNSLPADAAMVSHNALFDMCILSWRYGYVPKLIVDTLAMARTLLQHKLPKLGLGAIAEHYGLHKGDTVYQVIGMSRADIIADGMWPALTRYCLNDVALCRHIFLKLLPDLPAEELILHDMVARCAVEPVFQLNSEVLAENLGHVQQHKQELFAKAMYVGLEDKAQLMSNVKFAELLEKLGVDPPMKISKQTQKLTYAFSKTDPAFLELLDSDNPSVAALVEARLAHKSTLEETRTQRMLNIGTLCFPYGKPQTGLMPIPLIVGAAHTHRLGGGWKLNCQNWGRQSPIRKSIVAPPGHKVVVADSRQIEARMTAWFCGQHDLLEQFRCGVDVYQMFANMIGVSRFIGKTGILQLGYQSGWPRFQISVWLQSFNDTEGPVELSDGEAQSVVYGYRGTYRAISGSWRWLPNWFPILRGDGTPTDYGPLHIEQGRVVGPNGLCLYYDNLDEGDDGWTFDYHGYTYKLYGGKFLENLIQFLSRIGVMQAAVRLKKPLATYYSRLTHTSHDELVYIVPDKYVDTCKTIIRTEMTRSPDWAPTLPLDVEIGVGQTYGDAK